MNQFSFFIIFLLSFLFSFPLKTQSTKTPKKKNFEQIIINYNPENKSASSPQLNSIDSLRSSKTTHTGCGSWIIIVHLNTLINEASSSKRDSFSFFYTNQHFVESRYCCTFYISSSFSLASQFRIPWVRRWSASELNLHVTCWNIIKWGENHRKEPEVCVVRKRP